MEQNKNNKIDLALKISIIIAILLGSVSALYYFVIRPNQQDNFQKQVIETLTDSRQKSADASVQSNIATLRMTAEVYWVNAKNTYSGVCSDTDFRKGLNSASNSGGGVSECNVAKDGLSYAVASPLKSNPNISWCADSMGHSISITGKLGTATVCE